MKEMEKIVYFVRHCRSDNSVHEDRPRPLTVQGLSDADRVTEYFRGISVERVVSSPYKRAVDTVKGVAAARGLTVDMDEDLRERAVGGWVEDFDAFAQQQWGDMDFALAGGESLSQVMERGTAALERILADSARTTVVGTHGTALCALIHSLAPQFGYLDFKRIQNVMPWIVRVTFEGGRLTGWQEMNF